MQHGQAVKKQIGRFTQNLGEIFPRRLAQIRADRIFRVEKRLFGFDQMKRKQIRAAFNRMTRTKRFRSNRRVKVSPVLLNCGKPEIAAEIVRAVVKAVSVPVTVKTRIGWSDSEINILSFAQLMEDAGAQMITVHGRTRAQGYNGPAKWDWIRQVKEVVSIPVIGNGDMFSVQAAVDCLEQTGAD